uniref:Uncharacterized protein n=1 Tax=Anguilla anguilla TaxID=7936 RepID=A0A0E9UMJ3_ANGAN
MCAHLCGLWQTFPCKINYVIQVISKRVARCFNKRK